MAIAMDVVFMVVMSRGGDGTLKGDTSGHYNLHILPSGQQTVAADKYGEQYYQKKLYIIHIMQVIEGSKHWMQEDVRGNVTEIALETLLTIF